MAQFNPDDPRYQREVQRAAAKRSMGPSRLARVETGETAGRHAGYQLGRQQQFRGLALQSELARQRASQFDRKLGLSTRQQSFRESEFDTDMDRARSGINQTMLMGLLGTGLSVMEGRRREKILQSNIAAQNYRTGLLEDYVNRARGVPDKKLKITV